MGPRQAGGSPSSTTRLAPRAHAAPLHYHHNEVELSYVLTGRLGALLGDDVVTADAGTWVFKPRKQWHTFWNAGETPCEIIEVISPAGSWKSTFGRWPRRGETWPGLPTSTRSMRSRCGLKASRICAGASV
jgi:uncharacterized cupin superfamily protein